MNMKHLKCVFLKEFGIYLFFFLNQVHRRILNSIH